MTFTADLKKFAQKTKADITTVIQESAIDLFSEIIRETPVGDPSLWKNPPPANYVAGSLQSNWQCTLDSPASGMWSFADKSGNATISAMESVAMSAKPDQTIFLANNLPYGERIEYGAHSTQAPQGMVRVSVTKFHSKLAKEVAKVAA